MPLLFQQFISFYCRLGEIRNFAIGSQCKVKQLCADYTSGAFSQEHAALETCLHSQCIQRHFSGRFRRAVRVDLRPRRFAGRRGKKALKAKLKLGFINNWRY